MSSKKEKKTHKKSSKKRKDKEKDKKHKKHKKSSKSHDEDKKSSVGSPARNEMTDLLSMGMVVFPQLQTDLSGIIMALDSGKQFQLIDNGEKFNSFLLLLFNQLPLKQTNNVWTKSDYSIKLRQVVLENLLQHKVIRQPNTLSTPETLAMRAAQTFAPTLSQFPSLWKDIIPLLNNFIAGEAVDVSGIEILAIKNGLCSFFQSIGAKKMENDYNDDDEEMTYILPSKSDSGQTHKDDVRKAIQYFKDLFTFTDEKSTELSISIAVDNAIPIPEKDDSDSSLSPSSPSDDDDDDSLSDSDSNAPPPPVSRKGPGPTMPTKADLAMASKFIDQNTSMYEEDSNDEDDVGPTATSAQSTSVSTMFPTSADSNDHVPLGGEISAPPMPSTSGRSEASALGTSEEVSGKLQREEWMLTPGDRMPFGVEPSGDPSMPANRKFERGKLAKKTAEQIAAQREAEYEQYMNSEEGKEAEAVLEEYRKKRGPSLVQKHQDDIAAKRAKTGSTAMSELRQKGFDRDRDMSSHRQMGSDQVRKLINDAKQLDSRFSKSYARK